LRRWGERQALWRLSMKGNDMSENANPPAKRGFLSRLFNGKVAGL
jgi:hypothetical protein